MGEAPPRVALTRLDGTVLTPLWTVTLPTGERWKDGYAECVSSAGMVAVGDAGYTIYVLDERGDPALIPGQTDNLGECTWLDATTLLWDQEDPEMRAWQSGATASHPVAIKRFEPTAGAGRLAWFDDSSGTLRITSAAVEGGTVRVAATNRGLALSPEAHPVGLALSLDGRWLLGLVEEGVISIYPVSDAGLGKPTLVPDSDVGFVAGDEITWMPDGR
jgi:hypothetical protein